MLSRLAKWWLLRTGEAVRLVEFDDPEVDDDGWNPTGECVCGKQVAGADWHLVVAVAEDDAALGIDGGSAMSADFCADHCPGGCRWGCVPSRP
jgi:hypothetical protein